MNKKNVAMFGLLCLLGLWLLVGCSKKENTNESQSSAPSSAAQPAPAATPIDPSTVASVSGTVKFDGTAPKAIQDRHEPGRRLQRHQHGRDHRRRRRQTSQCFRVRKRWLGRSYLRCSQRCRHHRPEGLPIPSSCIGRNGGPEHRDQERRPDHAQHSPHAGSQS